MVVNANVRLPNGAHGMLRLPLPMSGGVELLLVGGPYRNKPKGFYGVNLQGETTPPEYAVRLPIRDFSTPENPEDVIKTIGMIIEAAFQGEPVWLGCMGGMGRTGLIMSILVKALGIENPVEYVREHYYEHAVETKPQYSYVMSFDVSRVQGMIIRTRIMMDFIAALRRHH